MPVIPLLAGPALPSSAFSPAFRPAVATFELGAEAVASTAAHDLPTAVVTSPTAAVTAGGPLLTVTWTYAQAQGDLQAWFRVVVTNDAESSVFYDSGFLAGAGTAHTFDAVAAGVPTETTDISVRVYVKSDEGAEYQGVSARQAFDLRWGTPVVTVSAPAEGSIVSTTTATVGWSYTDAAEGTAEAAYRVQLFYQSGLPLFDSGFVAGSATTYPLPFTFSDGSRYRVSVTARNTNGVVSATDSNLFSFDAPSEVAYTPLVSAGRLYEVAINGVGYMLYDNRDAEQQYEYVRAVVPVEPQRFATSATPLSEAVDHYLFTRFSDWKGGAGQLFHTRRDSAPDAYLDSDGVDPFTTKRLRLLHSVSLEAADTGANLRVEVVGQDLYRQSGAKMLAKRSTPGGADTTFTVAAATTITDLASDGTNWYAAAGAQGIFRNSSAADPGAAWSAIQGQVVDWAGSRVCAALAATGSTPNRFTTLNDAGAEEVTGGRLTLPAGWSITNFSGNTGFVFFGAYSGDRGAVYAWDLSANAPFVALEMPKGDTPIQVLSYQGQVIVTARRAISSTLSWLVVYRCPIDSRGVLSATIVTVLGGDTPTQDYGARSSMVPVGSKVLFAYPWSTATESGLGALDLSTGGYARWVKAATAGQISSVSRWQGRTVFTVVGAGVQLESLSSYVTSGYVQTSLSDADSNLDKVMDDVTLVSYPLGAAESFDVAYTIDGGASYTAAPAGTLSGAGQTKKVVDLDLRTRQAGLQVTLRGPGTSTPTLHSVALRYHAIGLADTVVQLPIDCGDEIGLLNDQPDPQNGPGAGAIRARTLQGLAQSRVLFQDVDFVTSQQVETFEVQQVQVKKVSVYDRNKGRSALRMVAMLTMRKRAK